MSKSNLKIFSITSLIFLLTLSLSVVALSYNEAPTLKEKVEAGELPQVDQRLPENPLVIDPLRSTGKYGGTWHRFSTWEEWGFFRMSVYGWSLVRWEETKDGYTVIPNLITDWESNEDKSSWTLHFREGVKWSDGDPFDVDDFLFWWKEMALNPEHSAYVPDWAKAGGETMETTKVDPYTLKLDYAAPAPLLMKRLAMWPHGGLPIFVVAPSHYLKQFHPDHSDEYDSYETFEQNQQWWHNPECPVLTAWKLAEERAGKRAVFERNPYYYAVDSAGNQLPYIDQVDVKFLSSQEVLKLKMINGEADMQMRPWVFHAHNLSLLKKNEAKNDYDTLIWDTGSGADEALYPNRNHPNPAKRELYRNPKFLRALSHALNRPKINKIVHFGMGQLTTGTFSPKAIEYQRTEEGRKVYQQWKNLAIEYDPEKSKKLLDELGVVDSNGDGWRELPDGKELKLRLDIDSSVPTMTMDATEIEKQNLRDVGLKAIVNPTDGSKIQVMQTNATFDIRAGWGIGDGPNHLVYPQWLVPINNSRWAPLYGKWFNIQGTAEEGTELDKDPRDRTPPRAKPPEGSPEAQLQELYRKAKTAVTWQERDKLVLDMIRVHLENGPFVISPVNNLPRVGVVKERMKNVPRKADLPLGGFVNPWIMSYIAITNPPQYYIDEG